MFLFRPSKNNQRYAIVPLLDKMDNDDEDFIDGTDDNTGKTKKFSGESHVFMRTEGKFTII